MDKSILDPEYNPTPIISVCGDDCAVCPRYRAKTDDELRQVAEFWQKAGWRSTVVSPEKIKCEGCAPHCACGCKYKILNCTIEHNVKKCPDCKEFPCDKVKATLESTKKMREMCRSACESDEEFAVFERAFYKKAENLGLSE